VATIEGVETAVCKIDMSDFDFNVFRCHLQEFKLALLTVLVLTTGTGHGNSQRVFDRMDASVSFCYILDATSMHTAMW
jgi:uncharacterized protein (DUF1786 family)